MYICKIYETIEDKILQFLFFSKRRLVRPVSSTRLQKKRASNHVYIDAKACVYIYVYITVYVQTLRAQSFSPGQERKTPPPKKKEKPFVVFFFFFIFCCVRIKKNKKVGERGVLAVEKKDWGTRLLCTHTWGREPLVR